MAAFILRQEEQSSKTDLLDVHADEDVLHRGREEQAARLAALRLVDLPEELVLVQLVEQEERETREAVDDGRDDGVGERNHDEERRYRPQRRREKHSPLRR